ncbi:MAG: DUF72 domain-containing protein [Armatimonadetes bacterium]|nr:DUF72 domain-containing protein [Armatimonadota bacterium]
MGSLYVGTCSWADRDFIKTGGFYPAGARDQRTRMEYYGSAFNTVEIDAFYHALQPVERVTAWSEVWTLATPPGFVFHAKAFALLTGHRSDVRRLPPELREAIPAGAGSAGGELRMRDLTPEARDLIWDWFRVSLRALYEAGKLGCINFQLPKYQRYSPEALELCLMAKDRLAPYRVAVEFRARDWYHRERWPEVVRTLREHGLLYTMVDIAPDPRLPPNHVVEVTGDWAVIRLHGRNPAMARAGTPSTEVYDYLYTEEELQPWAEAARRVRRQVDKLFVLFNNHMRGQSVKNARMLRDMIEAR